MAEARTMPAEADADGTRWSGLQRSFLRRQLSQAFLTLGWGSWQQRRSCRFAGLEYASPSMDSFIPRTMVTISSCVAQITVTLHLKLQGAHQPHAIPRPMSLFAFFLFDVP